MKRMILSLTCLALVFACKNSEEPIKVVHTEKEIRDDKLLDFKAKHQGRNLVFSMHYDWGLKPAYGLANIPDSLDIVVLKNNYQFPLSDDKQSDLKRVQSKGTRVLFALDLQMLSVNAEREVQESYRLARAKQDRSWDRNGDKPEEVAEVSRIYKAIKEAIDQEERQRQANWLEAEIKALDAYLAQGAYDGVSLRLPQTEDFFSGEQVQALLDKVHSLAGGDKSKLLVIEDPVEKYKEQLALAHYVVLPQSGIKDFEDYQQIIDTYADKKLIFAYDVTDGNLKKGFDNPPVFSTTKLSKKDLLLKYQHASKAGIAVYHGEKYYFQTENYKGFINPYVPLKALINELAHIAPKAN